MQRFFISMLAAGLTSMAASAMAQDDSAGDDSSGDDSSSSVRNVTDGVKYERPLKDSDRGYFSNKKDVPDASFAQTPYILDSGEWQLGIGPVAVGIADRVQLSTNIWGLILKNPNVMIKGAILRETKGNPLSLSVNVGGSYFSFDSAEFMTIDVGAAIGKTLISPDNNVTAKGRLDVFASGNYTYNSDGDLSSGLSINNPFGNRIGVGLLWYFSDWVKLDVEALGMLDWDFMADRPFEPMFAASIHMAWEYFNLRVGGWTFPTLVEDMPIAFLPYINLYWRFGGSQPTGN